MKKHSPADQRIVIVQGDQFLEPSDEERSHRLEILKSYRSEINNRHFACSDNFDKAILTYASAGLGFSLALYKDFLPHKTGIVSWLLPISWCFFSLAIVFVVVSYVLAQKTLADQLALADRWLSEFDESARRMSRWEPYSDLATAMAGVTFCIAVLMTVALEIFDIPAIARQGKPQPDVAGTVSARVDTINKTVAAGENAEARKPPAPGAMH